jgi:hypothetical protein
MRRFNLTGLVCAWLAPVQNCKIVGFSDDSATSPSEQQQAAQIEKVSAQLELIKLTLQVVASDH